MTSLGFIFVHKQTNEPLRYLRFECESEMFVRTEFCKEYGDIYIGEDRLQLEKLAAQHDSTMEPDWDSRDGKIDPQNYIIKEVFFN